MRDSKVFVLFLNSGHINRAVFTQCSGSDSLVRPSPYNLLQLSHNYIFTSLRECFYHVPTFILLRFYCFRYSPACCSLNETKSVVSYTLSLFPCEIMASYIRGGMQARSISDEKREWRKLHNKELHSLNLSPNIVRGIESRSLRCTRPVARME